MNMVFAERGGRYAPLSACPPAPFNEARLDDVSEKLRSRVIKLRKTARRTGLGANAVITEIRRGVIAGDAEEGLIRHEALVNLFRRAKKESYALEVAAENLCASFNKLSDVKYAVSYAQMEFCVSDYSEEPLFIKPNIKTGGVVLKKEGELYGKLYQ